MGRKRVVFPDHKFEGKRYRFCIRRRSRRRAKTYATNAKYLGFVDSYRIIKINNWWHVYGRGGKK